MYAFVHFYRECIRLENYAVINYQGFSKVRDHDGGDGRCERRVAYVRRLLPTQILKKHDKMTGYNTRSKYMRRKVNLTSFSSCPSLLQILSSIEEMFREVERATVKAEH